MLSPGLDETPGPMPRAVREEAEMRPGEEVWLRKRRQFWRKLPPSIKAALLTGVSAVGQLRTEIAGTAQVSSMPLVRIADAIWTTPDRKSAINGRATFIRVGQTHFPGVELPATVALSRDQGVTRAILVHEFAHCFHFLTLIVNRMDSGNRAALVLGAPDDVFTHEEFDRNMLVDPAEWFGKEDVNAFLFWNDERLNTISEQMIEQQLHCHLPIEVPTLGFSTEAVAIPEDVIDHIRRLRNSSRARTTGPL